VAAAAVVDGEVATVAAVVVAAAEAVAVAVADEIVTEPSGFPCSVSVCRLRLVSVSPDQLTQRVCFGLTL